MEPQALAVGEPVADAPIRHPKPIVMEGRHITLAPLDAAAHGPALYRQSHGSKEIERLWTYLPTGPFAGPDEMQRWIEDQEQADDIMFFTVVDKTGPVGMVSYLNVVAEMRRLEVGYIWYTPRVQRTPVNTEAVFLLLRHAFDDLGYRRVEWKCNALNLRSRAAAVRLGFTAEGVFANHMIVKGHNRDSAWYAMTDDRWSHVKGNMLAWLYDTECESSLSDLNAPAGG